MQLIDLSHPLHDGMPVYPGTPAPSFAEAATLDRDGYRQRAIALHSHVGTHVDAPSHLLGAGATLDALPLDRFAGRAVVIDATERVGERVSVADLEREASRLDGIDHVLLRTGWSRHWGAPEYFAGFPSLDPEAARWLAARGLRGFGVDAISVDPMHADPLAVHDALLGAGMILIENLTNLESLPDEPFLLVALPLSIGGGDGSPVRAAAIITG